MNESENQFAFSRAAPVQAGAPKTKFLLSVAPSEKPRGRFSFHLAGALLCLLTLASPSSAQTYDATYDFSVTNGNPNGVWSYGWMPVGFGQFNPYTNHTANPTSNPAWYFSLTQGPMLWVNTGVPASGVPTGWLSLHPGPGPVPSNAPSVVRWTAPANGAVRVQGQFLAGDDGKMRVAVRLSGLTTNWWGALDSGSFDLQTNVSRGATIDFCVYDNWAFGNTPLSATIAFTPVVPVLQLLARVGPTTTLRLTPPTEAGNIGWLLQYTTGLTPPIPWMTLSAFTALGYAPTNSVNFLDLCNDPAGFYRAVPVASNLVWIPPGTFSMGSPTNELGRIIYEGPQTVVTLTRGLFMGKYEVTQGEYQSVMSNNPSYFNGGAYGTDLSRPVEMVSWFDATNYCGRLTARERQAGRLPTGWAYRLPTGAEWEYACRAGTTTRFSYGDDPNYGVLTNYAWYATNSDGTTHPVGLKLANPWGLYDMSGNVMEWCQDAFRYLPGGSVRDLQRPSSIYEQTWPHFELRGGSWNDSGSFCRSAFQWFRPPGPSFTFGFRIVLAPEEGPPQMAYVWPGTFIMGSPSNEVDRFPDEGPQTEVTLTKPFYIGMCEVSQEEYLSVMGVNPSGFTGDLRRPVERVTWFEATNFCGLLTAREQAAGRLPTGWVYRLPTEAEWEYACRAGTTNRFSYGDDPGYTTFTNYGWCADNSGAQTHLPGLLDCSPSGLYDVHGNVWEWCQDWWGDYPGGMSTNPQGPGTGSYRVLRGGSCKYAAWFCRSAYRAEYAPSYRGDDVGFRVVLAPLPDTPTMVLIPPGPFNMGNCMDPGEGFTPELPVHTVQISAFYMDQYEVTKALWDEVYQWAINHGYSFENVAGGKAANHPAQTMSWYEAVKWCNARSEKEGRVPAYYTDAGQTAVYRTGTNDLQNAWVNWNAGYRLPTEAEWEKAARGGASGRRFPWSEVDTISHSRANYYVMTESGTNYYTYDVSPTADYHPSYANGSAPYTSPVGAFAVNGYGLYDMAGNVWEWCWDWYNPDWYFNAGATQNDTRGPTTAGIWSLRVLRGGSWDNFAVNARCANRSSYTPPSFAIHSLGFRCVRGL